MKKAYFILGLILIFGFLLRFNNLTTWPREGATFDEYAWTWQGMSLIQKGVPTSWSPLPAYTNFKDITYRKTHFRMVTPYLEHPPLFGLVAGASALVFGAKDMFHVNLLNMRPLALILGTVSIFLVYLLVNELFNKKTGLLAALLYATIPTIAVGSRILQNENFFIPLWLFSLFSVARYLKNRKKKWRNAGIFVSSILILAKIPWGAASLSLILIFLFEKKYKDAALAFIGVVIALLIYSIYGFYYNGSLFTQLILFQTARYDLTFNSIFALFQKPYLIDRFYTDGWIYFGWIASFILLVKNPKKYIFVILPLVSYFLVFLAGIPDEPGHGWYRYPFYPFLIISTALFLKEYFAKNLFLTFFFLVIVGSALLQNTWGAAFGFSYIIYRAAIISWMIPLSSIFYPKPWYKRLGDVINVSWFLILIALSIVSVLMYNEQ